MTIETNVKLSLEISINEMIAQKIIEINRHEITHLIENILSSSISLAHTGHSAVDRFAAVHVLDGHLTEEEVDVLADIVATDEIGLIQHVRVVSET